MNMFSQSFPSDSPEMSQLENRGYIYGSKKFFNKYPVGSHADTEVMGEEASNFGVLLFSAMMFVIPFFMALFVYYSFVGVFNLLGVVCSVVVGLLMTMTVHIAQEWEHVVVLRCGKLNRVVGPGVFFIIPVLEYITMRVDGRVRVTTFGAERTLSSDLVGLNVNAVLFWMVWDAKSACVEVGNFTQAVELAAQTALRDAIGRAGAADVAIRRKQLDRELQAALEKKVAPWGITIMSVEIRDILLPRELQDVMSLEAQAEQRKKARMVLMETEEDICSMLDGMSETYKNNETAMELRRMHLLYEGVSESKGTFVVPSSFAEGFGDIMGGVSK